MFARTLKLSERRNHTFPLPPALRGERGRGEGGFVESPTEEIPLTPTPLPRKAGGEGRDKSALRLLILRPDSHCSALVCSHACQRDRLP